MNGKHVVLIASILVISACMVMPVSATDKYYESKYVTVDPVADLHNSPEWIVGHVTFIAKGQSCQDPKIIVKNQLQPDTFDPRYLADGSDIAGQNKNLSVVEILPQGESELTPFAPGSYSYMIRKSDRDQPEYGNFTVTAHEYTTVPVMCDGIPTVSQTTAPELKTSCHLWNCNTCNSRSSGVPRQRKRMHT